MKSLIVTLISTTFAAYYEGNTHYNCNYWECCDDSQSPAKCTKNTDPTRDFECWANGSDGEMYCYAGQGSYKLTDMKDIWCNEAFCCDRGYDECRMKWDSRGYSYEFYAEHFTSKDFKDPWAEHWEHNRDFNNQCFQWNKFMDCRDFLEKYEIEADECYINYTFDNCGQNYCWIYKGYSDSRGDVTLDQAEDCLWKLSDGWWWESNDRLKKKAWAMSDENKMMYDYWTWYHYFAGGLYLTNECIPMNGLRTNYWKCDEEDVIYGDNTCWVEYNWNECGDDSQCRLWHKYGSDPMTGQWFWEEEPCRKEYDFDNPLGVLEYAHDQIQEQFPETFDNLVNVTCSDANCTNIPEAIGGSLRGVANQTQQLYDMLFVNPDPAALDFVRTALNESGIMNVTDFNQTTNNLKQITVKNYLDYQGSQVDGWLGSWIETLTETAFTEEKRYDWGAEKDCESIGSIAPFDQEFPAPKFCEELKASTEYSCVLKEMSWEGPNTRWGYYVPMGDEFGEWNQWNEAEITQDEEFFKWDWEQCWYDNKGW